MADPGSSPKSTPNSPDENAGDAGEAAHQPKHGAAPGDTTSSAKEAVDAAKETATNAVASAREMAAEAKARASEAAAEAKQRAAEAVDAARARAAEARDAAKAKLDKSDPQPATPDTGTRPAESTPAAAASTRPTAGDRAEPAVSKPSVQAPATPPVRTPAHGAPTEKLAATPPKAPAAPTTASPAATPPPRTQAATVPPGTPAATPAEPSIGDLVSTATNALSTLVRSEIELAKLELRSTVKNAGTGLGLFLGAVVVLVFSLTFGFIALAEGINALGLARWLSFLIVFGFQLLVVGLFVVIGIKKVKAVRAPEKTIKTTKETVDYLKTKRG